MLLRASAARADDPIPPPEPPPPPPAPYPLQPGQRPVYVAPLSQETQSTYVPQSVALSGPKQIEPLDDSRPPPDGYTAVQRTRKGMLIGGGVTFGVTYGLCALSAAAGADSARSDGKNELAALWVPVLGPFLQMADTDSSVGQLFLAGVGAAQVAGATMLFLGLTTTKRMFIRNDLVGNLTVSPIAGTGATGMLLSGQF